MDFIALDYKIQAMLYNLSYPLFTSALQTSTQLTYDMAPHKWTTSGLQRC